MRHKILWHEIKAIQGMIGCDSATNAAMGEFWK
jgi:hypothetical protein